jgi:hypothetical protein
MADVLTNNGEEWCSERLAGVQGAGTNNVFANNGSHIGFGTNAAAPAKGDTALGTEVDSRGATTVTTTGTGATNKYQAIATCTATTTRAIVECGLFSASSAGVMFTHSTFTVINLSNGDSIQFTLTIDPS